MEIPGGRLDPGRHNRHVGSLVRGHRHARGLSQDRLAELLGRDRRWVMKLERGEVDVTLALVEQISEVFGILVYPLIETLRPDYAPAVDGSEREALMRWARGELKAVFRANIRRPKVLTAVKALVQIPDDELDRLNLWLAQQAAFHHPPDPTTPGAPPWLVLELPSDLRSGRAVEAHRSKSESDRRGRGPTFAERARNRAREGHGENA